MTKLRSIANESLGWLIGSGILLILVGAIAICVPLAAGLAADTAIAVMLVIGGIGHFVLAWKLRSVGGSLWEVLVGLVYVAGGLLLFVYPISGLETLTGLIAIYLFASSVTELLVYYGLRFLSGSGWLLLNGIITFILALLIVRGLPFAAAWLPGTLVGFSMLMSGVSRLTLAFAAKRAVSELSA